MNWKRIEDETPPARENVILYGMDCEGWCVWPGVMFIGRTGRRRFHWADGHECQKVTHWMPLPKGPVDYEAS